MYEHLDRLVELATAEPYLERIRTAKARYFRVTGEVFEEDDFYEVRMKGFIEYYLFDYGEDANGPGTIDLVLEDHKNSLNAKEVDTFLKFSRGVHSIFELRKLKSGALILRNLWDNENYEVSERRALAGVQRKDLFEARLLPYEDKLYFSYAFVFHPKEVRKFIVAEIKQAKAKAGTRMLPVIHKLAYLRLKFDRYRGMDARKVYSEEAARQLEALAEKA